MVTNAKICVRKNTKTEMINKHKYFHFLRNIRERTFANAIEKTYNQVNINAIILRGNFKNNDAVN